MAFVERAFASGRPTLWGQRLDGLEFRPDKPPNSLNLKAPNRDP